MRVLLLVAAACGLALAPVVVGAPSTARAAFGDSIAFDTASASSPYGDFWYQQITLSSNYYFCTGLYSVDCTHAVKLSYTGPTSGSFTVGMFNRTAGFSSGDIPKSLTVGTYTFVAVFTEPEFGDVSTTPTPFKLTVVPAAMGFDLRVNLDANQPTNAIVSARLTGGFADDLSGYGEPQASMPAGAWKVVVADSSGHTAFTIDTPQSAGGDPFFSAPWIDVRGGETYSASGGFVVDDVSARNFTVTAAKFSYSSPASTATPMPTPTASAPPVATSGATAAVPVWSLLLAGLIALASVASIIVVSTRAHRSRVPSPPKAQPHSDGPIPSGGAS